MKKYFILLVSILFVGINPFTINTQVVLASLVEYGLIASDDELLTLDTDTGLEWLDLTATQNQSYNSVINGYGGYTTIHNFRVANASEINTLFQNVGIPDQWSDNAANIPGATDLFLFLGILREIGCNSLYPQYQSHGMSVPWQPCCPNSPKVSTFFLTYENQTPVSGRAYLDNGGTNMTSSFKYRGVFLVRDAASPFEPSSNQPSNLPPPCVAPPEPTITVTSPNGGEELSVGEVYEITWTSEGEIDFVKIEYSVNNGLDWTEIVANTDNEGSYDWIVPSDISNQSQVRISDVEGAFFQ
jgi:hypothetical protein